MKLYTEEQVKQAIAIGVQIGYSEEFNIDNFDMEVEDAVFFIPSIELPSDEDIDVECRKLPYEKHLDDGQYNDGQMAGFELGAYWMRQQILNQNK